MAEDAGCGRKTGRRDLRPSARPFQRSHTVCCYRTVELTHGKSSSLHCERQYWTQSDRSCEVTRFLCVG
jgi:hypothetical protein